MARKTTKTDQTTGALSAQAEGVQVDDTIKNTDEGTTTASAEALTQGTVAEGQAQPSIGEAQASPEPEQQLLPEASPSPVSEASTVAATVEADQIVLAPGIEVACLSKGGRRRAGRDWPEGSTTLLADVLTDYQLQQLRGDPRFRVGMGSGADLPCEGC